MAESPDVFTLRGGPIPASAKVLAFNGVEGLSRLYAFEVLFFIPNADAVDFDEAAAVLQRVQLHINDAEGAPRTTWHGVLSTVEFVSDFADDTVFRAVISPAAYKATLHRHSKVWVKGTEPDTVTTIIEAVLKSAGLSADEFELRTKKKYKPLLQVCQYRETDFEFVSRWMEREGLYYFFEHGDASEKMVIVDDPSFHEARGEAVRFFPTADTDEAQVEAMQAFRGRRQALPSEVVFRDWDEELLAFKEPSKEVEGGAHGKQVYWGENTKLSDRAQAPTDARATHYGASVTEYRGRGRLFDLRPGYLFTLEEHPRGTYNREYLTTALEHHGVQLAENPALKRFAGGETDRTYKVHVTAIESDTPYAAPRRATWPRIHGVEVAVVDGPADSDYAQLDDQGRYLVRYRFDEGSLADGKASMLVRMIQPHAGNPEGFHFPLRKGTQVMMVFLGGDPDQPLIVGSIPDPTNPSPVTSDNHTQNVVMTGGRSRIEIEDQDGAQYVDISTPPEKTFLHMGATHGAHDHNWILKTDGTGLVHTGGNEDVWVGGDLTEEVMGDVKETYHNDQTTLVMGDEKLTVMGDRKKTILGDEVDVVIGDHKETIIGDHVTTILGDDKNVTLGDNQHVVVGDQTALVAGNVTGVIGGDETRVLAGNQTNLIGGNQTTLLAGNQMLLCAGSQVQILAAGGTIISPPGYNIIAPGGYNVVAPSKWYKVTAMSGEATILKLTQAAIKIDTVVLKVDIHALKMENCGIKNGNAGAEIKALGAKIKTLGANIYTAAVNLFT